MSKNTALNRRNFLKNASIGALAGAAITATNTPLMAASSPAGSSLASSLAASETQSHMKGGKFDFDTPYNRIGTDCYKWDDQIRKYGAENVQVGMGVATMDFPAAPCVADALAKRCSHENWGYMVTPDSFIEAIVDWNRDRHGYQLDPDSVVISAGVYPGIIAALRTFAEPASKVVLLSPAYSGFYFHTEHTRTQASDSPMVYRNGRYHIDWDDLESRMTPDAQAMILCNPQNPTGNVWSEKDLLRIGRMCLENNTVVLSDEIHCDFVRKGQTYIPFAGLPDKQVVDNSMTFKAISKTFSLAAMKNAYFFSTNPVYLERVKANHRPDINALGIVANEAAYREGAEWFDQLLPYIDENHRFVEKFVSRKMPLVGYKKPQGTYLTWLDVSKVIDAIGAKQTSAASQNTDVPLTPEEVVEIWFVNNAGVQLNPGTKYGTGGEGHMRMNLGSSRQVIELALNNMKAALDKV